MGSDLSFRVSLWGEHAQRGPAWKGIRLEAGRAVGRRRASPEVKDLSSRQRQRG